MYYHNDRCPVCSKKQSKYAYTIEKYLIDNNFEYKKEYTYEDCKDKSLLFFDFAIFQDNQVILLEVDGEAHFAPVKSWGGIDGFKNQIRRDNIKNEYCKNNNIKLIRISYEDINNKNYVEKLKKELSIT
jgi:hypothetical protein